MQSYLIYTVTINRARGLACGVPCTVMLAKEAVKFMQKPVPTIAYVLVQSTHTQTHRHTHAHTHIHTHTHTHTGEAL